MNNIFNEDCFEYFKRIESDSVDMILTDPPYFLEKMSDTWKTESFVQNSHIKNVPLGMKFSRDQGPEFQKFMNKVAKEAFRILKPGGAFLSFSYPRLYHRMTVGIEDAGFEIRDTFSWIYTCSQVKAFSQDHIIRNDPDLDPELIRGLEGLKTPQLKTAFELIVFAMKPKEGRFIDNWLLYGTGLIDSTQKVGTDKFPSTAMTTDKINDVYDRTFLIKDLHYERDKKDLFNHHPTVKPVKLCEHLIRLFTNEEAIVVDPFMGSGTVAVAALNTGRHYSGSEMNKEYYNICLQRINGAIV